jgi:hypothetical protein
VYGQVLLCFSFAQKAFTWPSFLCYYHLQNSFILEFLFVIKFIMSYCCTWPMMFVDCLHFCSTLQLCFVYFQIKVSHKTLPCSKFCYVLFICKALLCLNLCLQSSLLQIGYIHMLMNCMCTFKVMVGSLKFLLSISYTFEGSFICEHPRPLLHVCALCRLLDPDWRYKYVLSTINLQCNHYKWFFLYNFYISFLKLKIW